LGGGLRFATFEVAEEADAHLLVEGFVALELAVGGVGGELFEDGEFVEAGGFEVEGELGLDAADALELGLGVGQFGGQEFVGGHGRGSLLGSFGAEFLPLTEGSRLSRKSGSWGRRDLSGKVLFLLGMGGERRVF